MIRPAATGAALLLVLALCACSPSAPAPDASADLSPVTSDAAGGHPSPAQTVVPIAGLSDMTADQKYAELSESFVAEWPAIAGTVTDRRVEGGGTTLLFTTTVGAPAAAVEQWYRSVMQGRAFVLKDEAKSSDGEVLLQFSRGGLQYAVLITPVGQTQTRVKSGISQGTKMPILK